MAAFSHFFTTACRLSGDPRLGLHIGNISNLDAMGIIGQLYRYSRNMIEGTRLITRYLPLMHTVFTYELQEGDEQVQIILTPGFTSPEAAFASRQLIELAMAFTRHGIQDGTQSNINPAAVSFTWPLTTAEKEHDETIFQCPVLDNQEQNTLLYDRKTIDIPHVFHDSTLLKALEASANAGLQFSPWSSDDLQKRCSS